MHVRVGIATGIVVVGDLLGSGEAQERGVVGDTPNLAARLQGSRSPTASSSPRARASCSATCSNLSISDRRELKGVAGPTRAYAALRESSQESRFEALHAEAADAARRARGRERTLASALGQGEGGRGSGRAALGRGGHRQVATDGGVSGAAGGRTACAPALFLLAAAYRQRALSDHRPHGARGRACARGRREDESSTSSTRCSHAPRPLARTPRFWPRCCPCRTTAVIPRRTSLRSSAGRRRWRR